MSSLFDDIEDDFNDHWLKGVAMAQPAGLFMALSTTAPADDATNITEPVGSGYARVNVGGIWDAAASRASSNNTLIQFAVATGNQGDMTHWVLFSAITGGVPLMYGALTSTVTINTGNRFEFPVGKLLPTIASGGWSDYLAHKCLDHILLVASFTQPAALYVAAVTVAVVDADTGTTITEPGGGVNYSRLSFEDFVASSGGSSANNTDATFPTASGAGWGNIVGAPILDAVTLGNLLGFGLVGSPQVIDADKIMQFDAGDLINTLD